MLIANLSTAPIHVQDNQVLACLAAICSEHIIQLLLAGDTNIGFRDKKRSNLVTLSTTTACDPICIPLVDHFMRNMRHIQLDMPQIDDTLDQLQGATMLFFNWSNYFQTSQKFRLFLNFQPPLTWSVYNPL